jgi:hypothetical protein
VLPRAFFVSDRLSAASDVEAVQLMQAATFDPSQTVVVAEDKGNVGRSADENSPSVFPSPHPSIIAYSPEQVVIDVNAPQAGYLVLTDAYYPGWTATVDGQPVEIERADIMFRAVKVPLGSHRVEFRYQPSSFLFGLLISIGTAVILAAVWLIARRRNKSRML